MKIGIVIPWFSDNISGGAERFAGGLARGLSKIGCEVEILTTCGRDSFWDWGKDYYKPAVEELNGLTVRRFKLRARNKALYEDHMGKVIHNTKLSYVEEMQYYHETINSDELNNYIFENKENYIYIFLPYLFGTTYFGTKLAPKHSFLLPCLHDEGQAYMKSIKDMFNRVNGILYNTIEEQNFANELYGLSPEIGIVSGGGVDINYEKLNSDFKKKYKIDTDYFLYVGRIVGGKNVPELLEFFNAFSKKYKGRAKLVVIGKGEEQLIEIMKKSTDIVYIGEVNDQEKFDAISEARALIQPSFMESFSLVIMESWLCNTPVIVHEKCMVTKGHCDRSNAGVYYKTEEQFIKILDDMLDNYDKYNDMGILGKTYVEENYTWEKTAERILNFFEQRGIKKEFLLGETVN